MVIDRIADGAGFLVTGATFGPAVSCSVGRLLGGLLDLWDTSSRLWYGLPNQGSSVGLRVGCRDRCPCARAFQTDISLICALQGRQGRKLFQTDRMARERVTNELVGSDFLRDGTCPFVRVIRRGGQYMVEKNVMRLMQQYAGELVAWRIEHEVRVVQ